MCIRVRAGTDDFGKMVALRGTEIVAVDIQSGLETPYGRGRGYARRCFLLFDGIHYDATEAAAGGGAAVHVAWTGQLDPSIEIRPVLLPGRESCSCGNHRRVFGGLGERAGPSSP